MAGTNKAAIGTLIDTDLASASSIPAADHRGVLKDDENSILNTIYPNEIQETHSSNTITISNANFNYNIKIVKQGRQVNINGFAENVSGFALLLPELFSIDIAGEPNFTPSALYTDSLGMLNFTGHIGRIGTENAPVILSTTGKIHSATAIGIAETIYFEITYNTLN